MQINTYIWARIWQNSPSGIKLFSFLNTEIPINKLNRNKKTIYTYGSPFIDLPI